MKFAGELLDILAQFGAGRGDPANIVVRFLLPSFFWSSLLWIAGRQWKARRDKRDYYVAMAAFAGLSRELIMFVAEYGGLRGFLSFESAFRFYPPAEHAITMFSCLLIGYAFMRFFLPWQRFSRLFLITGSSAIGLLYLAAAPAWIFYLREHPGTLFGAFWGDMVFRVTGSSLMGIVLVSLVFGRRREVAVPNILFVAFSFFFLDEFLMIFNLAGGEIYRDTFGPLRHNLHIWAVPLLVAVYWKELFSELETEKERLSVTLRSIGDGVIATDRQGSVILMNRVAEELTGWKQPEALGRELSEVFHIINEKTRETCGNPVEGVLQSGGIIGPARHTVLVCRDSTERIIADSGAPIRDRESRIIGVVLVFRDITEKRIAEEELMRAHKLESIGILAGGIAHDFNNILTVITGNISLAMDDISSGHPAGRPLATAENATARASDLARQLLTFSRGGAPVRQTASLSEMIRETASFAVRGSKCRCEFSIPDDLWPGNVDEGQVSQVIHNLVLNADQAMPQGGTINISCENTTLNEAGNIPLKKGRYLKITIRDEGIGIPRECLGKIFDPYFTTKQKGSGLGLAVSYSIIRNHDGHISADSMLGTGTSFEIYLPASAESPHIASPKNSAILPLGSGRILVMDDEGLIIEFLHETLRRNGYSADGAKDGQEAIRKYKEAMDAGSPFKAVIMDITIPGGMGGGEAIRKILSIDPSAKVIVSSGYSNDPIMSDFRTYGFCGVITKPYKSGEVRKVLQEVLGSGDPREETGKAGQ
ncbi:MAG: response regulator [Nitrospirae bacterium]|nr:response regulator [Nitrospirota bacterium]